MMVFVAAVIAVLSTPYSQPDYFTPGRGAKCCDHICMSVHLHISKTHLYFTKLPVSVTGGSVVL